MEAITVEKIKADSSASLAIDRACGAQIQHDEESEITYKLGFAAGAQWVLQMIQADGMAGK